MTIDIKKNEDVAVLLPRAQPVVGLTQEIREKSEINEENDAKFICLDD